MVILNMSLCSGRHRIPAATDGSIYPHRVDPMDLKYLESRADEVAASCDVLILYVTGLTVALTSVVKACMKVGTKLVVMHYDQLSKDFFAQLVNPVRNKAPKTALTDKEFRKSRMYRTLCEGGHVF